jgi:hypothetical protein
MAWSKPVTHDTTLTQIPTEGSILNHESADDVYSYATALSISRLLQRRVEGDK